MIISMSLFAMTALVIGGIVLQVLLCKKENNYLGLILPVLALACDILMVIDAMMVAPKSFIEQLSAIVPTFLIGNVPTAIFLMIYWFYKEKTKDQDQLKKMNIQDIE